MKSFVRTFHTLYYYIETMNYVIMSQKYHATVLETIKMTRIIKIKQ